MIASASLLVKILIIIVAIGAVIALVLFFVVFPLINKLFNKKLPCYHFVNDEEWEEACKIRDELNDIKKKEKGLRRNIAKEAKLHEREEIAHAKVTARAQVIEKVVKMRQEALSEKQKEKEERVRKRLYERSERIKLQQEQEENDSDKESVKIVEQKTKELSTIEADAIECEEYAKGISGNTKVKRGRKPSVKKDGIIPIDEKKEDLQSNVKVKITPTPTKKAPINKVVGGGRKKVPIKHNDDIPKTNTAHTRTFDFHKDVKTVKIADILKRHKKNEDEKPLTISSIDAAARDANKKRKTTKKTAVDVAPSEVAVAKDDDISLATVAFNSNVVSSPAKVKKASKKKK